MTTAPARSSSLDRRNRNLDSVTEELLANRGTLIREIVD